MYSDTPVVSASHPLMDSVGRISEDAISQAPLGVGIPSQSTLPPTSGASNHDDRIQDSNQQCDTVDAATGGIDHTFSKEQIEVATWSKEESVTRGVSSRKPDKDFVRLWKRLIDDWWFWEICNIVMGLLAMSALIGLLMYYNERPIHLWHLGVTLNGVIAALSTLWRSNITVCIGSCIGALKWNWFHTERRLSDMDSFDQASRGPLGSLKFIGRLVFRRLRSIAGLGAFVTVFLLAFDPFIQLLVEYPLRPIRAPSSKALAFRALQYTLTDTQQSVSGDTERQELDRYMRGMIQTAMLMPDKVTFPGYLRCPPGANCTWDPFPTLGVCQKCMNITQDMYSTTCNVGSKLQPWNCTYNLLNTTIFRIHADQIVNPEGSMPWLLSRTDVPDRLSRRYLNISNPITTAAILRFSGVPTKVNAYAVPNKFQLCAMTYCVQTWQTRYVNSGTEIKVLHRYFNNTAANSQRNATINTYKDIRMSPNAVQLKLNSTDQFNDTYTIGGKAVYLIKSYLNDQLAGNVTSVRKGHNYSLRSSHGDPYVMFQVRLAETIFEQVAWAMTLYMRTVAENYPHKVQGYTVRIDSIVKVRWGWLALPCALYLMTVILLALTMFKNSGRRIWKTSLLPVMFHGLEDTQAGEMVQRQTEMEMLAKKMKVKLKEGEETRLIGPVYSQQGERKV